MPAAQNIKFIDNSVAAARKDHYVLVEVSTAKVVESWRESLFSYEWLLPDGRIKTRLELPEKEQEKRLVVEEKLERAEPLEKPVLGIGLLENIEIGSGRATFLTLAAMGVEKMPVHIPKSNLDEFKPFLVK